jgi:hypothetical protein
LEFVVEVMPRPHAFGARRRNLAVLLVGIRLATEKSYGAEAAEELTLENLDQET